MRIISEDEIDPFAYAKEGRQYPHHNSNVSYDWDSWLTGKTVCLQRYQDFHCTLDSIEAYIRTKAKQKGLKVIVRVDRAFDCVMFRTYAEGEQVPYIPTTKADTEEHQQLLAELPTCRVCNKPLTGFSYDKGECYTVKDGQTHKDESV